jgi:predicted nucleic acid-binding protein
MTFVDTNVLLDVVTDDPEWGRWSVRHLEIVSAKGDTFINAIVYAEVSIRYARIEDVDGMLAAARIGISPIPLAASFMAGKAFKRYKAGGGIKTGVLSDFLIGAHALFFGLPLLTRDPRRYRAYFPALALITPGE